MQRLSNRIRDLMKQHDVLTEKELSMHTGVPQPTINRILTGATKTPRRAAIKALSAFFKVPLHALVDLNTFHSVEDELLNKPGTKVPLFDWENLDKQLSNMKSGAVHDQHIITFKKFEGRLFALLVIGNELEPKFSKETILVFKIVNNFKNRDYILLMSETSSHLKQVLIDGSHIYLKSLDSALSYPITKLDSMDNVAGVLVQSISDFGD